MTTFDQDDNWAEQVFGEAELAKLRYQARQIEEDHEASKEQVDTVSIETMFDRQYTHEILAWLRDKHYNEEDGTVRDFLWAVGCNIGFCYLTDVEWEYDEVMSDHATYFGARQFIMDDEGYDELDKEDHDLDDDDMDETDDES